MSNFCASLMLLLVSPQPLPKLKFLRVSLIDTASLPPPIPRRGMGGGEVGGGGIGRGVRADYPSPLGAAHASTHRPASRHTNPNVVVWCGGGPEAVAIDARAVPRGREVLERPHAVGGGGIPPPPDPPLPPDQSDHRGKTTKFTIRKIFSGHFWYTNSWVPSPPSLPPPPHF